MKLVAEMKAIHVHPEFKAYGFPRMTMEFRSRNFIYSVNTVTKLMRIHGIVAQRGSEGHAADTEVFGGSKTETKFALEREAYTNN